MSQVEEESLCNEVLDPMKRKLVENVKDSDEKDTKKAKIEEELEEIEVENELQMEKLMDNPNMWHEACYHGQTETAKLIVQYSKDFGIDLNAKDDDGNTALHEACYHGQTEID